MFQFCDEKKRRQTKAVISSAADKSKAPKVNVEQKEIDKTEVVEQQIEQKPPIASPAKEIRFLLK